MQFFLNQDMSTKKILITFISLALAKEIFILKFNLILFYLIEFSVFFEIEFETNKIIGYRLFITTLQPLGLAFFNFITKLLTI